MFFRLSSEPNCIQKEILYLMKKSLKLSVAAVCSAATLNLMNVSVNAQTADQGFSNWIRRTQTDVNETVHEVLADGSHKYVIQPGDTLSTIAKALGIPVEVLVDFNNIDNPDLIIAGEVIVFDPQNQTVTIGEETFAVETVEETAVHPTVDPVAEWLTDEDETVVQTVEAVEEWTEPAPVETPVAAEVYEEVAVAEPVAVAAEVEAPVIAETTTQVTVEVEQPVIEEYVEPTYQVDSATLPEYETYVDSAAVEAEPAQEVAPVVEEPIQEPAPAPVQETTPAHLSDLASMPENAGLSPSELEAKYEIRRRESTHRYDVYSPSGNHYGAYQMLDTYFHTYGDGTRSVSSQEAASNGYVQDRYGSWEAALQHHNANNWY